MATRIGIHLLFLLYMVSTLALCQFCFQDAHWSPNIPKRCVFRGSVIERKKENCQTLQEDMAQEFKTDIQKCISTPTPNIEIDEIAVVAFIDLRPDNLRICLFIAAHGAVAMENGVLKNCTNEMCQCPSLANIPQPTTSSQETKNNCSAEDGDCTEPDTTESNIFQPTRSSQETEDNCSGEDGDCTESNTAVIIGASVGGACLLAVGLIMLIGIFAYKRRKKRKEVAQQIESPEAVTNRNTGYGRESNAYEELNSLGESIKTKQNPTQNGAGSVGYTRIEPPSDLPPALPPIRPQLVDNYETIRDDNTETFPKVDDDEDIVLADNYVYAGGNETNRDDNTMKAGSVPGNFPQADDEEGILLADNYVYAGDTVTDVSASATTDLSGKHTVTAKSVIDDGFITDDSDYDQPESVTPREIPEKMDVMANVQDHAENNHDAEDYEDRTISEGLGQTNTGNVPPTVASELNYVKKADVEYAKLKPRDQRQAEQAQQEQEPSEPSSTPGQD